MIDSLANQENKKENKSGSNSGKNRQSSVRKKGGGVVDVLLPLNEVNFECKPIETFHPQHGVAHRMIVNDLDCVMKLVDAKKDMKEQKHWNGNHPCTKRLETYAAIFFLVLCSAVVSLLVVLGWLYFMKGSPLTSPTTQNHGNLREGEISPPEAT